MARIASGPTSGRMTETALRVQQQSKEDERLGRKMRADQYKQVVDFTMQQIQQQQERQFAAQQAVIQLAQQAKQHTEVQARLKAQSDATAAWRHFQAKAEAKKSRLELRGQMGKEYAGGMKWSEEDQAFKAIPIEDLPVTTKVRREQLERATKGEQATGVQKQRYDTLVSQYPELVQENPEFFLNLTSMTNLTDNQLMLRARQYSQAKGKERAIETFLNPGAPLIDRQRAGFELGKEAPLEIQIRDYMVRADMKRRFDEDSEVVGWKTELTRVNTELGKLAYMSPAKQIQDDEYIAYSQRRNNLTRMIEERRRERMQEVKTLRIPELSAIYSASLVREFNETVQKSQTAQPQAQPYFQPGGAPPQAAPQRAPAPKAAPAKAPTPPSSIGEAGPLIPQGGRVETGFMGASKLKESDPEKYEATVDALRQVAAGAGSDADSLDAGRILRLLGE